MIKRTFSSLFLSLILLPFSTIPDFSVNLPSYWSCWPFCYFFLEIVPFHLWATNEFFAFGLISFFVIFLLFFYSCRYRSVKIDVTMCCYLWKCQQIVDSIHYQICSISSSTASCYGWIGIRRFLFHTFAPSLFSTITRKRIFFFFFFLILSFKLLTILPAD